MQSRQSRAHLIAVSSTKGFNEIMQLEYVATIDFGYSPCLPVPIRKSVNPSKNRMGICKILNPNICMTRGRVQRLTALHNWVD